MDKRWRILHKERLPHSVPEPQKNYTLAQFGKPKPNLNVGSSLGSFTKRFFGSKSSDGAIWPGYFEREINLGMVEEV
jgi:hypothetical protein